MVLDIRRLATLHEVAVRGSIAAAARSLSLTASAVSQQLATLERETGHLLLERHGRGVRLTDAGALLADHAERLLAGIETAEGELARLGSDPLTATVKVAAFPSAVAAIVPRALADLSRAHADLRVELIEAEPDRSLPALRLGEIDVAIVETHVDGVDELDARLRRVELFEEAFLVVAWEGLLPAGPVDLASLAGRRWSAPPAGSFCGRALRVAAARAGFEPDIRYEVAELAGQLALAAAGVAVALVPAMALRGAPASSVSTHELAAPSVRRRVLSATRPSAAARPSVQAVEAAVRTAASTARPG